MLSIPNLTRLRPFRYNRLRRQAIVSPWLRPASPPHRCHDTAGSAPLRSKWRRSSEEVLLMDQTRIIGSTGEATQLGGYGAPGWDSGATAMGAPPGGLA